MGEVLFKDAWRTRASWAAKTLGPALVHFGQMAVGLESGGEGMATALQVYCDAPSPPSRVANTRRARRTAIVSRHPDHDPDPPLALTRHECGCHPEATGRKKRRSLVTVR